MANPRAVLTPKGERWFRTGHPWVFRDDLARLDKVEDGDITALYDHRDHFLAWAFYSRPSRIAFRIISRLPEEIGETYWMAALEKAIQKREGLLQPDQACRLVFAEADSLPGLIADWYAGHLVLQTLIPGTEKLLGRLEGFFQKILNPFSILLRNDLEARGLENLPREVRTIAGQIPERVLVREGEIHYAVDLRRGHKTGAYLDQRDNRVHLGSLFKPGGRVLDGFCFSGGFSLHLARGAAEVMAVDDSAPALDLARQNAEANSLSNITFHKENLFNFLKKMAEAGKRFDLIILDPPPFARKKSEIAGAVRGYLELNRRALLALKPGGRLSTYSCSHNITEPLFQDILSQAAQKAGVKTFLLEKRLQARDHPILLNFPESHYLKGLTLQRE